MNGLLSRLCPIVFCKRRSCGRSGRLLSNCADALRLQTTEGCSVRFEWLLLRRVMQKGTHYFLLPFLSSAFSLDSAITLSRAISTACFSFASLAANASSAPFLASLSSAT